MGDSVLDQFYDHRFSFEGLEIALSASVGILLSFEYRNYTQSVGQEINIGVQILVAFVATLITSIIIKVLSRLLKLNYDVFTICECCSHDHC